MQFNSRGGRLSSSPPLPDATRSDKKSPRRSTRRGSATSWLLPQATTDAPTAHDGRAVQSSQSSVQADDYRLFTSDSSSILSGVETVAPQSQRSSTEQSSRRGPYGLLTGLLMRRTGEAKSRKAESVPRPEAQPSPPRASTQGTVVKPSSRAARNPLLEGYDTSGPSPSAGRTQIGAGGYDWPSPPSPIKAGESLHPPDSSSRHELTGSPMLSLQSHSSPNGAASRGDRREKRSLSRFADQGESHFVPLGASEAASRVGSASVRRPEAEEANMDSALSTSTATNRPSIAGWRRNGGHGNGGSGFAATGGSLSNSESQSNEHLTHTRGSQARTAGTDDNELSAPSSSSNVRSMRDAKAALLRHAQGTNASVRTSRAQSFRRLPSNGNTAMADPPSLPTHRAAKTRGTSKERRSFNNSHSGANRDDGGSLYSIGVEDDAVRTSMSPGSMGSPILSRPGVLFPATAVNQDGNMASMSHVGTSRRFSRTEIGSGPILEVMETSALTSRGNVNGTSNVISSNSGQNATMTTTTTTRGRSAGSMARSGTGRLGGGGGNASREDAAPLPFPTSHRSSMNPRSRPRLSGGYSLSRTGGYGDSEGSEGSAEMEERHRHKVDEVLRRLNRPQRSTTGNNQSTMSRAAASETGGTRDEVVAVLSTNGTVADAANSRGTSVDNNNNSTSVGGGVMWSGIGGLGWGSLANFGSTAADSTTEETGGNAGGAGGNNVSGGWAGLGGDGGSDDWYARMRKKAEEEEKAEAAAATATTANTAAAAADTTTVASDTATIVTTPASPTPPGNVTVHLTSPGTVSMTMGPALGLSSSPFSGRAQGPPTWTATAATGGGLPPTVAEAPMPSVARTASSSAAGQPRRSSALASLRRSGSNASSTPVTSLVPSRPLVSARTPVKPPTPTTGAAPTTNATAPATGLTTRFRRRMSSTAGRPPLLQSLPSAIARPSPLDPPMEDLEEASSAPPRLDSRASTSSTGRQVTLPGMMTAAAFPARRASRSGGALLTATASPNAEVDAASTTAAASDSDNCAQLSKARSNSMSNSRSTRYSGGDSAAVVLPTLLSPQRAETSTPLSSNPSSGATTPGHRRFDFRRRGSLPRVLPLSSNGNAGTAPATSAGTASVTANPTVSATTTTARTLSSCGVPRYGARNGRMSLASNASMDTFGKGVTQPASPSLSTRAAAVEVSSMSATTDANNTSGNDAPLATRRNSSPAQRKSSTPFPAIVRTGSNGTAQPPFVPQATPKKPEVASGTPRAIAASARLSFS